MNEILNLDEFLHTLCQNSKVHVCIHDVSGLTDCYQFHIHQEKQRSFRASVRLRENHKTGAKLMSAVESPLQYPCPFFPPPLLWTLSLRAYGTRLSGGHRRTYPLYCIRGQFTQKRYTLLSARSKDLQPHRRLHAGRAHCRRYGPGL